MNNECSLERLLLISFASLKISLELEQVDELLSFLIMDGCLYHLSLYASLLICGKIYFLT
jgi:hypothetical protein